IIRPRRRGNENDTDDRQISESLFHGERSFTRINKEEYESTKGENSKQMMVSFFSTFRFSCFRVPLRFLGAFVFLLSRYKHERMLLAVLFIGIARDFGLPKLQGKEMRHGIEIIQ